MPLLSISRASDWASRRPIECFDHIEQFEGFPGLVRLQRPNEVQDEARVRSLQLRPFRLRLLYPVLAENPLTGADGRLDDFGRMGFRDADQGHALRVSACLLGRHRDAMANFGQAARERSPEHAGFRRALPSASEFSFCFGIRVFCSASMALLHRKTVRCFILAAAKNIDQITEIMLIAEDFTANSRRLDRRRMQPERYNPREAEAKWQRIWQERATFSTQNDDPRPKYYVLEMFPYPSGRIHMGHVRNYAMGDVVARFQRARGFNVLHPMGWDAFGMPAENAAMQNKTHPAAWTYANIATMREQLKSMGLSLDWSRELATCDPAYYKHQQRMFLDFLDGRAGHP